MRNTIAKAKPWMLIVGGSAVVAITTVAPVAQHAAVAASGGWIGSNDNQLFGV